MFERLVLQKAKVSWSVVLGFLLTLLPLGLFLIVVGEALIS